MEAILEVWNIRATGTSAPHELIRAKPDPSLAWLSSAWLKSSQSGSFANFFEKTSKYNNSDNFNPNLIKLPPFNQLVKRNQMW